MATPRTQSMAAIRLVCCLRGMAGDDSAEGRDVAAAVSVEVVMSGVTDLGGVIMVRVYRQGPASPINSKADYFVNARLPDTVSFAGSQPATWLILIDALRVCAVQR